MARELSSRVRRPAGGLEGEVLAILWSAERPLSATEVQVACAGGLAYNTVHTILTRLQIKEQVRRVSLAGRSAYQPVKDAAEAAADQMRAVLESGVDRGAVLTRFVTTLSAEDEAALRAALESGA